jgi:hypothetical protein
MKIVVNPSTGGVGRASLPELLWQLTGSRIGHGGSKLYREKANALNTRRTLLRYAQMVKFGTDAKTVYDLLKQYQDEDEQKSGLPKGMLDYAVPTDTHHPTKAMDHYLAERSKMLDTHASPWLHNPDLSTHHDHLTPMIEQAHNWNPTNLRVVAVPVAKLPHNLQILEHVADNGEYHVHGGDVVKALSARETALANGLNESDSYCPKCGAIYEWGGDACNRCGCEERPVDWYGESVEKAIVITKALSPETLTPQIVSNLTDDLRRAPYKGNQNPLTGHCYVASEAMYHMMGGKASGWVPMSIRHEGEPHWYLKHVPTGTYVDPTEGQFSTPVPHDKGTPKGFLTKVPSKRAQELIRRVTDPVEKALTHDDHNAISTALLHRFGGFEASEDVPHGSYWMNKRGLLLGPFHGTWGNNQFHHPQVFHDAAAEAQVPGYEKGSLIDIGPLSHHMMQAHKAGFMRVVVEPGGGYSFQHDSNYMTESQKSAARTLVRKPSLFGRTSPSYSDSVDSNLGKFHERDLDFNHNPSVTKSVVVLKAIGGRNKENDSVWWHGSVNPEDLRGGRTGLHLGTHAAAHDALNAAIGFPAVGHWDGTREYAKTLLAGKKTLITRGLSQTGRNCDRNMPEEDYYQHEHPRGPLKFSNGDPIPEGAKPGIRAYRIVGPMSNSVYSPHDDFKANGYMQAQLKRGTAKRGYFYSNVGEDSGSVSAVVPNGSHVEHLPHVTPTNPDLKKSIVVTKAIPSQRHPLEQEALRKFGTTTNPFHTGYILRDGTRLDFSGRHEGGQVSPQVREVDHVRVEELPSITYGSEHGNDPILEFLHRTGAVRVSHHPNQMVVQMIHPMSLEQKSELMKHGTDLMNRGLRSTFVGEVNPKGDYSPVKFTNKPFSSNMELGRHLDELNHAATQEQGYWRGLQKAVGSDGVKISYHGTPYADKVMAEGFKHQDSPGDQHGPGFYFTNNPGYAHGYTEPVHGPAATLPGVISAHLHIKNPIVINQPEQTGVNDWPNLTRTQAHKIIHAATANMSDDDLSDWGDVAYEGRNRVLRNMVDNYTGISPATLIHDLPRLGGGSISTEDALRHYSKVSGHDGVRVNYPDGTVNHIAWFPEQVQIHHMEPVNKELVQKAYVDSLRRAESQTDTNPTPAQVEAENFRKGSFQYRGLTITIENPKGSIRRGKNPKFPWEVTMGCAYGYFNRQPLGRDGDPVDVFVCDENLDSDLVFIVNQVKQDGSFDEEKIILGCSNEKQARRAYLSCYSKGWKGLGSIKAMHFEDFVKWLDSGDRSLVKSVVITRG